MIVFIKCMPGLSQSVFFYNTCIQYSHLSLFLRQRIENYYLLLPEALLVGWDFEQTEISFFHQYLFLPAPVFLRSTGWDERTSILLIVWNSINITRFSFYLARCFKRQVPQPLPHIRSQTEVLQSQSNELTAITAILNEPLIKKKMSVKHGAGI